MAPTHTRKRQYQPSNQTTLNSYFNRDANPARSPISPPLPPEVQASLLSVGMRVRKSVPEGYKTEDKMLGSAGYPFPSSAPAVSPHSPAPVQPAMGYSNTRELQPFCGLHKTGGWGVQHIPASSAPAAMRRGQDHNDDMPALSSSQNTLSSTQNSFMSMSRSSSNTNKRAYEDETEDDMDAFFDEGDEAEAGISQQPLETRRMAPMKSSTRKSITNTPVHILDGDDFEEASFLLPMDVE